MSKKNNEKITISKVAELSKVSKTTVSRYINDRKDLMSDAVARRIQDVIDETGFRPNRVAQILKSNSTNIIGCVVADVTSYFSSHLVKGVSDACNRCNYQVLIVNTNNDPEQEKEAITLLIDNKVDGLIVNTSGCNDEYLISVKNSGMPIVIAGRHLDSENVIDTISSTNYQSTFNCIEYLYQQGYDDVYFFCYLPAANKKRGVRYDSYVDAMERFYKPGNAQNNIVVVDPEDIGQMKDKLNEVISLNKNIALFAVNGMVMLDIVEAVKETNYEIGKDFGLCGFDDWRWMKMIGPGITAIRQNTFEIGKTSAERLFQLVNSKELEQPKLLEQPTELMKRGSTKIPESKLTITRAAQAALNNK